MLKSRTFLYLCFSFLAGIFLASFFQVSQLTMLGFLILGILLVSVTWQHKQAVTVGFCLLILVAGIAVYQRQETEIMRGPLSGFNNTGKNIVLIGVVKEETDVRENSIKLKIRCEQLAADGGEQDISGNVLVSANRYPEYQYGDRLRIEGKLETPSQFPEFNYQGYLAKDGISSTMFYPDIRLIEQDQGSFVYGRILNLKNKIRGNIYQNFSPPESLLFGAMFLGDKNRLTADFKEQLSIVGLRHITAISGMHITILSLIIMSFLIGLGFWRGQAFYITLILLFLFIIMIGLPASAIRAGVMGGLLLLAQKLGRLSQAYRTLIFAAVLMLLVNPLLARFDIGFQLSFLAAAGIIFLSPFFRKIFFFIPESFSTIKSVLIMTLSAQIFTLPLLIFNFGRISLIAPVINILIVPIMPFILGIGIISGVAGLFWLGLGRAVSLVLFPFLFYIVKVTQWFSSFKGVSTAVDNLSFFWLVFFYLALGLFVWRFQRKYRKEFLNY